MNKISRAIIFATEKHEKQTRKDGITPYIYHPLELAIRLKNQGYGENFQLAAILHDTLEDTDATEDEILVFGKDVLEAVKLLTRNKGTSEEDYLSALLKNEIAKVVKEEDKKQNLQELRTCTDKKFIRHYLRKSQLYKGKLSNKVDKEIEMGECYLEDLSANYWIYESCGRKAIMKEKDGKVYVWRNSTWEVSKFDIYSDEYGENLTSVKYEDIKSALI